MARVMAITDLHGALLGVVRADPIEVGKGITIQAVPPPTSQQRHHILEVPDSLVGKMGKDVEKLHQEVLRRLPAGKTQHKA